MINKFDGVKKIILGSEGLDNLFENGLKTFIVCDPFLVSSGQIKYITDRLDAKDIPYMVYSDVTPDPGIDLIVRGIQTLADYKPEMIVAIGGGSAIDACKGMIYFSRREKLIDSVDFVAIPTTSGTGSEVTSFAVITDTEQEIKYPLVDEQMLPDIAVLDAHFTLTVPPQVTAATGMDVLTHAIEAFVSINATDFSDALAEKAIKLVRSNIIKAYKNPENLESRQAMHNASTLAGIAFNNAGLGLNHGMAHALGAKFHIPHGKANAILLPYVMSFNAGCYDQLNSNAKKYARIARLIKVESGSIRNSALNLIRTIKYTNERLDIPKSLMDMGIDKEEFRKCISDMSAEALNDRCTQTNPRIATIEDIEQIYAQCYYGMQGKKL